MKYQIFGENLPAVTISLDRGESIYTQSGGMSWMSAGIDMKTNMQGGLMKGLGRMFSGESLFMATYTAMSDDQQITLGTSLPGSIRVFEVGPGKEYIAQKQACYAVCRVIGLFYQAFQRRAVWRRRFYFAEVFRPGACFCRTRR